MRRPAYSALLSTVAIIGCRPGHLEPLPAFDRSQLADHAETFAVSVGGAAAGTVMLQQQVQDDSVRSTITTLYHDSVVEQVTLTFDNQSLMPRRVRATNSLEVVDLVYSRNRVTGTRMVWTPVGKRDTLTVEMPFDSVALDRRHLLTIVPWLPLVVGHVFTVSVFDSWTGHLRAVRIAVEKESRVTVPAGTFRVYRLRLTTPPVGFMDDAGLFPTILFVTVGSPRTIVRIERPQQDAVTVLTGRRPE